MDAFFLAHPHGLESLAGKDGDLFAVGTSPGEMPLPPRATLLTGASLAAIRAASGITLSATGIAKGVRFTQVPATAVLKMTVQEVDALFIAAAAIRV